MSASTAARVCLSFLGLVCLLRYVMVHSKYLKNSTAVLYFGKYKRDGNFKTASGETEQSPFEEKDLYNLSEDEMKAFFRFKENQVTNIANSVLKLLCPALATFTQSIRSIGWFWATIGSPAPAFCLYLLFGLTERSTSTQTSKKCTSLLSVRGETIADHSDMSER